METQYVTFCSPSQARGNDIAAQIGEPTATRAVGRANGANPIGVLIPCHRVIGADGSLGPLRDTLLVERDETAEIAFVADNPGDWLLHCHMLEHSVSGMMTWIRVDS